MPPWVVGRGKWLRRWALAVDVPRAINQSELAPVAHPLGTGVSPAEGVQVGRFAAPNAIDLDSTMICTALFIMHQDLRST